MAAVHSKVVTLLLLIQCVLMLPLFFGRFVFGLFYDVVLFVLKYHNCLSEQDRLLCFHPLPHRVAV